MIMHTRTHFFPNWEQTVLVKPEGFSQPFVDVWSRFWMVLQYPCANANSQQNLIY
jgi:hypothetical protein